MKKRSLLFQFSVSLLLLVSLSAVWRVWRGALEPDWWGPHAITAFILLIGCAVGERWGRRYGR